MRPWSATRPRVREFVERDLGPEGLACPWCQPRGQSAVRVRAALPPPPRRAFPGPGSRRPPPDGLVTRTPRPARGGPLRGEPPATKGYPPPCTPSCRRFERAGTEQGSITGLYTVLVEGDDVNEPIADAARSILDGHLWLSRRLANRGQYPAIDPLESVSRVMTDVVSDAHRKAAQEARGLLAIYQEHEDLINLGAYVKGANPRLDRAVALIESFRAYLKQDMRERSTLAEAVKSRAFECAGEPAPRQPSMKASTSRWRLPTLRAAGARRPSAPCRRPCPQGPQILELAGLTGSIAPRSTADPPRQGPFPWSSHGPTDCSALVRGSRPAAGAGYPTRSRGRRRALREALPPREGLDRRRESRRKAGQPSSARSRPPRTAGLSRLPEGGA